MPDGSIPTTPFEHYMAADDRPSFPMAPVVRLTFDGECDRERLTRAARTALALPRLAPALTGSLRRLGRVLLAGPAVLRGARLLVGRLLLIQLIELPRESVETLPQFLRARQIRRQLVGLIVTLPCRRHQRIGETVERPCDVLLRARRAVRRGRRRVLPVRLRVGLSG